MKTINETPLLSVLMPNYNNEKYLSESIESILNQTYKYFEFIIVDDCSTDNSWKIIQKYVKKDKRIKAYKNEKNMGCTISLNNGLIKCSGEFIARMDSDDIAVKSRFKKQIDFMLKNKTVGVCGVNLDIINENSLKISERVYPKSPKEVFMIRSSVPHPGVLIRKKLFSLYGKYDSKFKVSQDYDLWLRLISNGVIFFNLQENLLKYRISKTSTKYAKLKETISNTIIIKEHSINNYGLKFNFFAKLRLLFEKLLLVVPTFLIKNAYNFYLRLK